VERFLKEEIAESKLQSNIESVAERVKWWKERRLEKRKENRKVEFDKNMYSLSYLLSKDGQSV
jgi:hypothetical protein